MATGLAFKVYVDGQLVATTRYAETAAAVLGFECPIYSASSARRGRIEWGGRVVWSTVKDGDAGQSYDAAAIEMNKRALAHNREALARVYGGGVKDARDGC